MTRAPLAGSRLAVGSSATRRGGCLTSARATATRCCSPRDSSVIRRPSGRHGNSAQQAARPRPERGRRSKRLRTGADHDVPLDGQPGQEVEVLKHEDDMIAAPGVARRLGQTHKLGGTPDDGAGARGLDARQEVGEGGLPDPIGPVMATISPGSTTSAAMSTTGVVRPSKTCRRCAVTSR